MMSRGFALRSIAASGACFLATALALAQAPTEVTMWVHAGPGPERKVYEESVAAFHAGQRGVRMRLVAQPEGAYAAQVEKAAKEGRLPCLLDLDGPLVSYHAWAGHLRPLDDLAFVPAVRKQLLRTLERQGTYGGKLYSLAQYDSGLALWGNRRLLAKAGVRIPATTRSAWTLEEFEAALQRLKALGLETPLDMKFNYGIGEWFTYGFSPIVQSFGGDLIDRSTMGSACGALDSPAALKALQSMQRWVKAGYVSPKSSSDSDFAEGRAALSYVGHWVYQDYLKTLGDDLVLIPMPKFGARAVTGAGSWSWAISSTCPHPEAAALALQHLMTTAEIVRVTEVNGAVPATVNGIAFSPRYTPGGRLRLYVDQIMDGTARVRPQTPAYPAITAAFATAVRNILIVGADPQKELDLAVSTIDADIRKNHGYAPPH